MLKFVDEVGDTTFEFPISDVAQVRVVGRCGDLMVDWGASDPASRVACRQLSSACPTRRAGVYML